MNLYRKYKYIFLLVILLLVGAISYIIVDNSYGAFSNVEDVRLIISNVSSAFYDRGSYIQYDSSYMDSNNMVKRNSGFYYPEDANKDNTIYMDSVSFIANVFYTGLSYDIADTFGDSSLEGIYSYGSKIYSEAVLEEDDRVNKSFTDSDNNSYVIDFYDDRVMSLSASIGKIDYHILTMYVNNNFISEDTARENIYNKLISTLKVGDIIVYKDYVLLYVGTDTFMYCYGDSYDYENKVDKVEDRAIKYGTVSELNDKNSDKYIFSGDNFYVFRLANNYSGFWTLPNHIYGVSSYFNTSINYGTIPWIKIEKYGSVSSYNDVYKGQEITYTIRITNNSFYDIVLPDSVTDSIGSNVVYVSNSYSEESYSDGVLTFSNIGIMANSYVDISYTVRVLDEEGTVINNSTKIGDYPLNDIVYNIAKNDMDISKLKDKYSNYSSVVSMYKKLYKIDLDFTNIWDNVIDEEGFYKDGYSLLVNGLYGGVDIGTSEDMVINRTRDMDSDYLVMGDIVIYNDGIEDKYLLYIEEDNKYLVSYDDEITKISDIDSFLESIMGMSKFMVIRPNYIYDPLKDVDEDIDFSDLEVLADDMIILVRYTCTYEDLIMKISNYDSIIVKDINDIELSNSDIVKSSDKLIIDDKVYSIALLGDITGDGEVGTGDVLKLHRFVLGKTGISEKYYLVASYINNDDEIGTGDVLKLHRVVLGKDTLS